MKNIITLSQLERMLLCVGLAQVTAILEAMDRDVDGIKLSTEYLKDYRKFRAVMGEHSPSPEDNIRFQESNAEDGK